MNDHEILSTIRPYDREILAAIRPINWDRLPEHMHDAVVSYLMDGRAYEGSFFHAILTNNLSRAFSRADPVNRKALEHWVAFLWNECPREAWGSGDKVEAWKGLRNVHRLHSLAHVPSDARIEHPLAKFFGPDPRRMT